MELALGTVQFGLGYGIVGRGQPVPEDEVSSILSAAAERGVRVLDTAAAYGDIEEKLAGLCGGLPFRVISKIPAIPPALDAAEAIAWALASARQSRRRLGGLLDGLMFHNAGDLANDRGRAVWNTVRSWAQGEGLKLGASCYAPQDARELFEALRLDIAQIPGNAFDQRINTFFPDKNATCEIYLRSAFLQGLLLMPREQAQKKLPQAAAALEHWHLWCAQNDLDYLGGALSVVKSMSAPAYVVVGVDSLAQFEEIAVKWQSAEPVAAPGLSETEASIIDPRQWRAATAS